MRAASLAILVWFAALGAAAFAQTTLSPTQFRDYILGKAKAQRNDLAIEITGPLSATVDEARINLDGGYADYTANPSDLDAISRKWVQMLAMISDGAETSIKDLPDRIVQVVRSRQYIEQIGASTNDKHDVESTMLWRPLAGDVVIVMMANYENMMGGVGTDLLNKANLSVDAAWDLARRNTAAQLGTLQVGSYGDDGPVAISAESALATSLLAEPNACTNGPLAQDAIVLVVDRNAFIIGRPSDPGSIGPFWKFAKQAIKDASYASSAPLTCKNGKWIEAAVPH